MCMIEISTHCKYHSEWLDFGINYFKFNKFQEQGVSKNRGQTSKILGCSAGKTTFITSKHELYMGKYKLALTQLNI